MVLEGVKLDTEAIEACKTANPLNDEEAVQAGLIRWKGGQGKQPPTWAVLLEAMKYAEIDQVHIEGLKEALRRGMLFVLVSSVCTVACVWVCAMYSSL